MKFFIVGLHSSGKQEIISTLEELGIRCGKVFSNIDTPSNNIYNSFNYEYYTDSEVKEIFENNAYIFYKDIYELPTIYEGLSLYEFDNNDVFVLSPD